MQNKEKTAGLKNINDLLIERFGVPGRKKILPDPVDLIIATILSQNTNDKNSYKAFQNLKNKFPEWESARRAERGAIEKEIKTAGLGFQKSSAIKNLLDQLFRKEKKISLDYLKNDDNNSILSDLTAYKGVGIKTASCVLLFALGRNVCPVDTHVHRILNRIGSFKTTSPDKTFVKLNENFPKSIAHSLHTNLIRLGREICKPAKPRCSMCPLEKVCSFEEKNFDTGKISEVNDFMLLDSV